MTAPSLLGQRKSSKVVGDCKAQTVATVAMCGEFTVSKPRFLAQNPAQERLKGLKFSDG